MSDTLSNAFDSALVGRIVSSVSARATADATAAQIAADFASALDRGEGAPYMVATIREARRITNHGKSFNTWLTAFRAALKRRGWVYATVSETIGKVPPIATVATVATIGNGAPHGDKKAVETDDMRALRDRNVALSARIRQLETELDKVEAERDVAVKRAMFSDMQIDLLAATSARAKLAETLLIACAALEDATRAPHAPRKSRAPRGKRPALTAVA